MTAKIADEDKVFEFRIEYVSENSIGHNYHYYLAHNAKEALTYQLDAMNHKRWNIEILNLERKCPYANKWIDESYILNELKNG
jgi:hypothetical protein